MEYPCGGGVSPQSHTNSHSQPSAVFSSIHRKPKPPDTTTATGAREAAVRAAKKHLREIVRDDWTYEPSPSSPNNDNSTSPPAVTSASVQTQSLDVQEWREREFDTPSCTDTEDNGVVQSPASTGGEESPCFPRPDSPDAAERRVLERRTKRRRLMEEEMSWNTGLKTFVERRDVWSGAQVMRRKRPAASSRTSSKANERVAEEPGDKTQSCNGSRNSAEEAEVVDHESSMSSSLPLSATADTSMTTAPDLQQDEDSSLAPGSQLGESKTPEGEDDSGETFIPVVPPIIPHSNPVRASINSSIYPSIYSKVVIQSLTPTIPINLSDMTKCLVQGWKSDGQWPPQGTTAQDPVAVKKRAAVGQYNPVGGIIGGAGAPPGNNKTKDGNEPVPTSMRQKRGSGVSDTMKKVLSFPLHPFHLRRGSQASTEQPPDSPDTIRNA